MFFTRLSFQSVCIALAMASCAGGGSGVSGAVDSVAVDSVVPEVVAVASMPDTMLPSASVVDWSVTLVDSAATAVIDNLDDAYSDVPGVFTFRGNATRTGGCVGRVTGRPSRLEVDWRFDTEEDFSPTPFGMWGGGTGWTGQPLYVEWPDSLLKMMRGKNLVDSTFGGREIIVGSLCMKAYFLDMESGVMSRRPIDAGNPVKGTLSLDPSLNGNLYLGQGVPASRPFGACVIDLYKNHVTEMFGEDRNAYRGWGAYDSSPLRVGQFLFRPGENGTLYKFTVGDGSLKLHSTLRYRVGGAAPGMEASMSQWRNYGYVADNHGNVICVNLNTLKPVWHFAMGDDTDASPVLAEEDGTPYLYIGCEVDRRPDGKARFVKINALDGTNVWEARFDAMRRDVDKKHFDGGFYATALLGQGNCSHLVFGSCVMNGKEIPDGDLVAMDRRDGRVVYRVPLKVYGWSSPVGFVNENSEFFIVVADCGGRMYLIDGADGSVITSLPVGANFESSPVVVGNSLVVGSRGKSIYKVSVK